MRVRLGLAALAILGASVAACGDGDEAASPPEPKTEITTTTRSEVVPTTKDPIGGGPLGLSGTEILVHGDMYGTLTDSVGNAMGVLDPATGIELTQTPGGTYHSTGDDEGGQYFLHGGVYEGAWTVEEDDEVRFVVRNHADDEVVGTSATLPFIVHVGDTLSLDIGTPADLGSLELAVDEGGDGSVDRTVPFGEPVAGAGASDRFQPVSRVKVEHVTGKDGRKLARVTITVNDAGGAGVARIEYALDPSGATGVYTEPIEVPVDGKIVVRAIDRAGNIEAPYPRVSLSPKPAGG